MLKSLFITFCVKKQHFAAPRLSSQQPPPHRFSHFLLSESTPSTPVCKQRWFFFPPRINTDSENAPHPLCCVNRQRFNNAARLLPPKHPESVFLQESMREATPEHHGRSWLQTSNLLVHPQQLHSRLRRLHRTRHTGSLLRPRLVHARAR